MYTMAYTVATPSLSLRVYHTTPKQGAKAHQLQRDQKELETKHWITFLHPAHSEFVELTDREYGDGH